MHVLTTFDADEQVAIRLTGEVDGAGLGRTGLGVSVVWSQENGATVIVRYDGAEAEIAPAGGRN